MSTKALDVLKVGLIRLKEQIKTRKNDILDRLSRKEHVADEDEHWLDNEANLVDEDTVLELLDKASDYERGLQRLNSQQKTLVEKLKELGGGIKKAAGNKRKRPKQPRKTGSYAEKKKAAPVFTKKENATLKQKIEILDWHHGKTAAHWNQIYPNLCLKQPTISAWLKDEPKYRQQYADTLARGQTGNIKRVKQTEHPEVNEMLELWVTKAMSDEIPINGEILRQKWNRFADLQGVPEDERLALSDGWLTALKRRCGLRNFKRHGEAASADIRDIEHERERLRELIRKHGYRLKDIFNMDETGLFWAMPPDRGLMDKPSSGVKGCKKRLTYAFTMNATGSEKLPPFVIGKATRPRAFQRKSGAQLGFYYRSNAKAWMTGVLYQEWLRNWDAQLRRDGRKILLLQDNFSAHIVPDDLTNIRVENFAPNLTPHVQPADAGVIRCFKAHYRARFMNRAIDRYDSNVSPANIYDLNILEAMRMADMAWKEVDTTTIYNCWRKTGILPDSLLNSESSTVPVPTIPVLSLLNKDSGSSDPIVAAEDQVSDALTHLERIGVLQQHNRMDLRELLNLVDEKNLYNEGTEEEIHQAVLARREAEEGQEQNGGNDMDDEETIDIRKKAPRS
ncbi:hypothetical protein D9615_009952 [Tricholomella constricta]|uniref:HTH CENPB-type domain-containing protein n=1 Tax=Tricholomella constricta TaxID=117010 RepID=A0A8H5LTU3_9AGAR|nr:hypothetical protein D9615_009952 [Tricholomella constricta]